MKLIYSLLIIWLALLSNHAIGAGNTTITFPSLDELEITADTYFVHENTKTPLIVLFHQAGWSRGEYLEIAPTLNQLGFNCIAVDLRSGETVNGIKNKTAALATAANKPTRYIDTLPDILTALRHVNTHYPESDIIAWGSSYSAALVLHVSGENPDLVDGVLAFAPGEYFSKQGKSKTWVKESAAKIIVPVFITSARNEKNNWSAIFDNIPSEQKTSFIPDSKGNHGSRALWEQFRDSKEYWNAVNQFLRKYFL